MGTPMKFSGGTIEGMRVPLDAAEFRDCTFIACTVTYSGGALPVLSGNTFVRCSWQFEGPANNTVAMLQMMYRTGAKEIVEQMFKAISEGQAPQEPTQGG